MAKPILSTGFRDDILNESMGGKRRYKMTENSDGTVSFEDVTTYDQVGSNFAAGQVNAIATAVNQSADATKIIDSPETIEAVTEEGYIAGALALKEVQQAQGGIKFYTDKPKLVYLVADNKLYKDENGKYVLADSETGKGLLANADTYYSAETDGVFFSVGGADSVSPFSGGVGDEIVCSFTATVQMWNQYGSKSGDFLFVISKNTETGEISVSKTGTNISWSINVASVSSLTISAGAEVSNATISTGDE